ncbi:MAG: phenylalanine--tRNA ligase subunit beta [Planctomycetota bacterium]
MLVSLEWLNACLDRPIERGEAGEVLTSAGFPIEGEEPVGEGDWCLDVEVTSNRPDVLSHVGVAREVAAATGRGVVQVVGDRSQATGLNEADPGGVSVGVQAGLEGACPLYTGRVIRGVTVGPSPAWLVKRLEAVGQRSVNNVVDVTNYVMLQWGQPLHAFDLDKLVGGGVVVRESVKGEGFSALDGTEHELPGGLVVIADGEKPVALAGVMGGTATGVVEGTTDVLLEAAVFDAVRVRTASRALKLRSDSSFRFERGVDDLLLPAVSAEAVRLIVEVAGGEVDGGLMVAGGPTDGVRGLRGVVEMRLARCCALLGVEVSAAEATGYLERLGFSVEAVGDVLKVGVPSWRLDVEREVDVIEEVARAYGLAELPVLENVSVEVRSPTGEELAKRAAAGVMVGAGYCETVTPSFVAEGVAGAAQNPSASAGLEGRDAGALVKLWRSGRAESVLRPSVLLSLLQCRKANLDAGNGVEFGGVRLWELASCWAGGVAGERRVLGWLADVGASGKAEAVNAALRGVRGMVEALVERLGGGGLAVRVEALERDGVYDVGAEVSLVDGPRLGVYGLVSEALCGAVGLKGVGGGVVGGELDWGVLGGLRRPVGGGLDLPRYPAIERDVSVVVDEGVAWSAIEGVLDGVRSGGGLAAMEGVRFLGVYRGKQLGQGKKSVSFRLAFRDAGRTLTREEVEPQAGAVVEALKSGVGAELRG